MNTEVLTFWFRENGWVFFRTVSGRVVFEREEVRS